MGEGYDCFLTFLLDGFGSAGFGSAQPAWIWRCYADLFSLPFFFIFMPMSEL
jgi:hypothetical protein